MKRSWVYSLLIPATILTAMHAGGGGLLTSEYTDLTTPKCKEENLGKQEEGDDSTSMMCPGVGGYKLQVISGDLRYSINVIDASGKSHALNFWDSNIVTGSFSSLGPKAEWLSEKKGLPLALIVRVNASENSDKPNQITSYLAVAKISSNQVCVTDKIAPGAKMNEEARLAAQSAATKPCRK